MSFDAATLSAIAVSLIILVFLVFTIRGAEKRSERKMRQIAHQTMMMQRNHAAWELCRLVHEQYPNACAGLDFTFKEDAQGVSLDQWNLPHPRPEVDRIDTK